MQRGPDIGQCELEGRVTEEAVEGQASLEGLAQASRGVVGVHDAQQPGRTDRL
ncbi:hypothetical protein [Nonomuraea sp. NPDC050643]|uniref:hypothetical protein n=1 Tax=Nonomuraea sp. NPDC050643 TaxID=3155660 RepID=UPI0033F2D827